MAQTVLDICNLALAHLGEASILSLTDDTTASRACSSNWEPTRDEVLRSHRWNFASKRASLSLNLVTITSVADASGLVAVTKAGHGLTTGDRVEIDGSTTSDGVWTITVTSTSVFKLDGSAYSASTVAGTYRLLPAFGWTYQYTLPTDCLRVLEVNDSEDGDGTNPWLIEGRKLLTNDEECRLVYLAAPDDTATYDPLFVQALALKLAVKLSDIIRGSTSKTEQLLAQYERVTAPLARRVDANEARRRKGLRPMNSLAIQARLGRGYHVTN